MAITGGARAARAGSRGTARRLAHRATLGVVALCVAAPAMAADEDGQAWAAANATVDLGSGLVLWLEAQLRFTDDAGRLGQTLLRPAIGMKLGPDTTAMLGYAFVATDPVGPALLHEHRIWEQLSWRLAGDGKSLTITGRTRFEQRFVEGRSGTGWRLRQQVRLTAPLAGKVRAVLWTEPFIGFNRTEWGQPGGLDRWRNFGGVALPATRAVSIEPGYLNQWVVRRGADRVEHIASLTLSSKF